MKIENIARQNFRRRKNGLIVLMWTHCTKYQIQKKMRSLIITEHFERYIELHFTLLENKIQQ